MNDTDKIKQMDFLLSKLYTYSKIVFIHGMHVTRQFSEHFYPGIPGYLGTIWFYHLLYVNSYAKTNCIIPIVDLGLDEGFSRLCRLYTESHNHLMGSVVSGNSTPSIENFGNIMEPLFSKDEYSIGVQMADLVGAFRFTNTKLYPNAKKQIVYSTPIL